MFSVLLVAEVLQGIGPKKVAHGPKCGGLFEAVKLKQNEDYIIYNRCFNNYDESQI